MPWKSTWTLADLAEEFNNRPNLDGVELFEREKNGVVSQLYPDDLVNDVVSLTRCWSPVSRRKSHIGGGAGVLAHQTMGDTRRDLDRPTDGSHHGWRDVNRGRRCRAADHERHPFCSRIQPGAPWRARNFPELNGLFIKSLDVYRFSFYFNG